MGLSFGSPNLPCSWQFYIYYIILAYFCSAVLYTQVRSCVIIMYDFFPILQLKINKFIQFQARSSLACHEISLVSQAGHIIKDQVQD